MDFEIYYFLVFYALEVRIHVGAFDRHDFSKEKEIGAIFLFHCLLLKFYEGNVF
jgi:hypothetical protein